MSDTVRVIDSLGSIQLQFRERLEGLVELIAVSRARGHCADSRLQPLRRSEEGRQMWWPQGKARCYHRPHSLRTCEMQNEETGEIVFR